VVRLANLLEAEGRAAKRNVFRLVAAVSLAVASSLVMLSGILVLGFSLLTALRLVMHPATALLLVGLSLLLTGVALASIAGGIAKQRGE
jgi:hypothetical protein